MHVGPNTLNNFHHIQAPLHSFDTALAGCLREDMLGAAQFFRELQVRLSWLPLRQAA